jgi:L,D-transpeptidase ErfK/SrfK
MWKIIKEMFDPRVLITKFSFLGSLFMACIMAGIAHGSAHNFRGMDVYTSPLQWKTVVGWNSRHVVSDGETLLDIARNYALGWNEIEILYPNVDPWVPDPGTELEIPESWILPSGEKEGIVINIPELRLYRYVPGTQMVETYPVGIGTEEYQTPTGEYRVVDRKENPVWAVPPSLKEKYPFAYLPPGPDNPLGDYWLGLSAKHIGIHGTNFPWAVGRQVSRGCIRLYPEHIQRLYPAVPVGTRVRIVYEPVKVGFLNGGVYIEVHPDADGKKTDLLKIATERLQELGNECYVFPEILKQAIGEKDGVPIRIGTVQEGGDEEALRADQITDHILNEAIN